VGALELDRAVGMTARRVDPAREAAFWAGAREAGRFFMGDSDVHRALRKIVGILDEAAIPYAIVGGLALNAYGYQRATMDVDVLLTHEGLAALKQRVLGLGYAERVPGGRGLRDLENRVDIDIVIAGEFPGDGKPKPVAFPDPALIAERGDAGALVPLTTLIELKLASGISAPHRMRDLADVLELIRAASLPASLAEQIDASVRPKYLELWQAACSSTALDQP
jgi:hypothetical protein